MDPQMLQFLQNHGQTISIKETSKYDMIKNYY